MEIFKIYLKEQSLIKKLRDKALMLLKILDMMNIKLELLLWLTKLLMKRISIVLLNIKSCKNKEFAKELHKPIIRKFEKLEVH